MKIEDLIINYHVPEILKDKEVVFLSGTMTGTTKEEQKAWRDKVKAAFEGCTFIDPTVYDTDNTDPDYQEEGHNYCMRGVVNCDWFVINLNKAEKSVGICQELMLAWLLGKTIIGVWTDKKYKLHPWIKIKLGDEYDSIDALIESMKKSDELYSDIINRSEKMICGE